MTSTSPDLPRPNRRGFSCDTYDVAYNHRDVARTSPQRETALGARNTCRRGTARLHWGDIARPWVQRRYVSRPCPRRARHSAPRDHEGGQAEDPICPRYDHRRWPEGARRLIELAQERAAVVGVGFSVGCQRPHAAPAPLRDLTVPKGRGLRCDPGPACQSSPTVRQARNRRYHPRTGGQSAEPTPHWRQANTSSTEERNRRVFRGYYFAPCLD